MARQFDRYYRVKRKDNLGDPEYWNRRFEDLDIRIARNEDALENLDEVADNLEKVGLDRLNQSITPLVQETQARLRSIANMFTALSVTTNTIAIGATSFFVIEEHRNTFAAVDYVSIRATEDETQGVVGRVVSYNQETGELIVQVEQTMGEGTYHEWQIAISSPPDLVHAGRFDNPHMVTALQVGAYTKEETDTAINSLRDTLRGGVASTRDTLKKISDLRDADIAALNIAIGNKADTGHIHDGRYYTKGEIDSLAVQSRVHGSVRLVYVNAGQISLIPEHGGYLIINGVLRQLGGWISVTNAGLPASAFLYVYAYMSGSNIALTFSGTGYARNNTTGVFTMAGDPTKTLVGCVFTNGAGQFQQDSVIFGVRSLFNEGSIVVSRGLPGARQTASQSWVALAETFCIVPCLGWETWQMDFDGMARSLTTSAATYTGFFLDWAPWITLNVIHHMHGNRWGNSSGGRAAQLPGGAHTIGAGFMAASAAVSEMGAGSTFAAAFLRRSL